MSIDLTYLATLHTDHQTSITQHLIHHPEDEHHPLMALLVEALDSLAYIEDEMLPPPSEPEPWTNPEPTPIPTTRPRLSLECRWLPARHPAYVIAERDGCGTYTRKSKKLGKPEWVWCVVHSSYTTPTGYEVSERVTAFRNRDHAVQWHEILEPVYA